MRKPLAPGPGKSPNAPPKPQPRRRRRRWVRRIVLYGTLPAILWITGCMERFFYYPTAGLTVPPPHLDDAEDVFFESRDGTRLHGWFIPARGVAFPAEAPTVVHVHGNAGNIESHIGFSDFLPPAGFNLFVFDYRGYGQSEGSPWRRAALIEDANAAIDTLLTRTDIDRNRIVLFGQSLGGGIGLSTMATRQELRAAVIVSAFSSWRDVAANAIGGDPPNFIGRTLARLFIKDGDRPIDAIRTIDRPILLIHGTADRTVPSSHSPLLADAAPQATLLMLEAGDHNTLRLTHPQMEEVIIAFLEASLPTTSARDEDGEPEDGANDEAAPREAVSSE